MENLTATNDRKNTKGSFENLKLKLLEIDRFGPAFKFNLPGGKERHTTTFGAVL